MAYIAEVIREWRKKSLAHYGVRGMHWDHRKAEAYTSNTSTQTKPQMSVFRTANPATITPPTTVSSEPQKVLIPWTYGKPQGEETPKKGGGKGGASAADKAAKEKAKQDALAAKEKLKQEKERLKKEQEEKALAIKLEATKTKLANDYASEHPDDPEAQILAYRAQKALDIASGGLDKGPDYDAAVEASLRVIAESTKAKMASSKPVEKTKEQLAGEKVRIETNINDFVDAYRARAKKNGQQYTPEMEKKDRETARAIFTPSTTPLTDIDKDKIRKAISLFS